MIMGQIPSFAEKGTDPLSKYKTIKAFMSAFPPPGYSSRTT